MFIQREFFVLSLLGIWQILPEPEHDHGGCTHGCVASFGKLSSSHYTSVGGMQSVNFAPILPVD